MSKVNSRKGFTIAELVVAMAIIFIVSATAIGIINTQNTVHLRTTQTVEATNMAENAIECFRYAVENPKENNVEAAFVEAYAKTGISLSGNSPYTFEKNGMTVTIEIATKTEENAKTLYTLTFNAVANGNTILTKSYTK